MMTVFPELAMPDRRSTPNSRASFSWQTIADTLADGDCLRGVEFTLLSKTTGTGWYQSGGKRMALSEDTPRTNGKAERFIQTALREWAYARAWKTSQQRAQDLPKWTHI